MPSPSMNFLRLLGTKGPGVTSDEQKSTTGASGHGLPVEQLVPGTFVTVSENKRIADRSLVYGIWEIVAVNETHIVLQLYGPPRPIEPTHPTLVVPLHEHDFYRADHLAAAIERKSKGQSAAVIRLRDE